MYVFLIFLFLEMDCPVWQEQCHDCGKRFPNLGALRRHIKRVHGPRLKCRFCWWSCQSHQKHRLDDHEREKHKHQRFTPCETPTLKASMSSVVMSVPTLSIPECPLPPLSPVLSYTEGDIECSMPDFAYLLRIEPSTTSPLRCLRDSSPDRSPSPPLVGIPSNELFSKYLRPSSSAGKDPSAYSPSDEPFLHPEADIDVLLDLTRSQPVVTLSPQPTRTTTSTISVSVPAATISSSSPVPDVTPVSPPYDIQDEPLDLSVSSLYKPTPVSTSSTSEIDCTKPTNHWAISTVDVSTDSSGRTATKYDHMGHDPRLFFAGAPSSYLKHPLSSTLQEKINLCRHNQKARYGRRLMPVGVSTIIKEERCYLPDGTFLELRDTWTAASLEE